MEEWRLVPSYSQYECSTSGQIRNVKTKRDKTQSTDDHGYKVVGVVSDSGEAKVVKVARFVAAAHIVGFDFGDPKQTIDHIDRAKDNNDVSNLRVADMHLQASNKDHSNAAAGKRMPVEQRDKVSGNVVATHVSVNAAARSLGKAPGSIGNCCNGKLKSSYGFRWNYVDMGSAEVDPEEEWRDFLDTRISSKGRTERPTASGMRVQNVTDYGKDGRYRIITIAGRRWRVHRLMAHLFLGMPDDPAYTARIKDGNVDNLCVTNIEVTGVCLKKRAAEMKKEDGGRARDPQQELFKCSGCMRVPRPAEHFIGKSGNQVKTCTECRAKDAKQAQKPEVRERKNEFQRGKGYDAKHRAKKREEDEEAYLAHNAELMRAYMSVPANRERVNKRRSMVRNGGVSGVSSSSP